MRELQGRSAFVTGGGSGIGRGIALALAKEGMKVAVGDINPDSASRVAEELRVLGTEAIGLEVDVTDEASLARAASRAEAELGRVRVLSNNAGVSIPQGPMTEKTQVDWDWAFSVNVFGIVKSVQAILPQMRAAIAKDGGDAHIVNTSSMAGLVTIPPIQVGIYGASKYACNGYTEQLRADLAGEGIGVSVLCPGYYDTPLTTTSAQSRPEQFGGAFEPPAGEMPDSMPSAGSDPETVGPIVVHGIRENLLHIITHPESRPMIEARFAQLMADYDAAEKRT